tara:strand:+ start:1300 stop:2688 length:1389 start_codon:yes stop_codon:yes gene_type:complete
VWEEHIRVWLKSRRLKILVVDRLKVLEREDPREYDITIITRNLVAASFSRSWKWEDNSEEYRTSNGQIRKRGAFQQKYEESYLFKRSARPTLLVIDESHYLRNFGRKKVCLQAHNMMGVYCKYGILNTATPVCNRPEDVAGQLYGIALDRKGKTEGVQKLTNTKQWKVGKYTINTVAVETFNANCHRRTERILSLPELRPHIREFALAGSLREDHVEEYNQQLEDAREVRAQMKGNGEVDLESLRRMMNALTRMGQMVVHPKLFKHGAGGLTDKHRRHIAANPSPMLLECSALVRELRDVGHKKLVVFGMHSNSTMDLVKTRMMIDCPGHYDMYHGGLSQTARAAVVARFLAPSDELQVLFIQMVAGGVGLNLVPGPTAAIFIQQSWNPMDHLQAYKRIHRIGQDQPVDIYNVVGTGTPDAAMRQIHEDKIVASDAVVNGKGLGDNPWRTKGRAVDLCEFAE